MTTTVPPAAVRQYPLVTALAEIVTTHPSLPAPSWSIDPDGARLYGHIHQPTPAVLHSYATALGGTITTGDIRDSDGRTVRTHLLTTTWRSVPVTIAIVLPAEVA